MDPRIDDVLACWFGTGATPSPEDIQRWFTKDPAFDDALRQQFGALHDDAAAGRLIGWQTTARGALALIVVLDQFSRNLFRGDPRSFATDALALASARALRASDQLGQLDPYQQMFTLLPYEHAEDPADQATCIAGFVALVADAQAAGAPPSLIALLENGLDYARQHAVIIERFGRFPHRNAILGRASTPEELAFLDQPGSSF